MAAEVNSSDGQSIAQPASPRGAVPVEPPAGKPAGFNAALPMPPPAAPRPPASTPYARLICGAPTPTSELRDVLVHLADTIDLYYGQVFQLWTNREGQEQLSMFGPVLARGLLELSLTALLARLDPFRVLVLREMQLQGDYSFKKKNLCAIQWSGDILAEGKVSDLWKADRNAKDLTRALLGDYYDHVFWQKSFLRLLDLDLAGKGGFWMQNLVKLSPEGLMPSLRQKASLAYSESSKGIHHEFVIPTQRYFDRKNLQSLFQDVLELTSVLGVIANMSNHLPYVLSSDDALDCFDAVQAKAVQLS